MEFVVCRFVDKDAKETNFHDCSLVLGIIGDCGFAYPLEKERFENEVQVGDVVIFEEDWD